MSQSLSQIYVHIIYSTKGRRPFLTDEVLRTEMHKYLAAVFRNQDSPALEVGGVADHIHALCRLSKTGAVADLIRDAKRESSAWIKGREPRLADFSWQAGYGAFSISPTHVEPLRAYIRDQVEHHRRESFQDEFRRLCRKYGVALDERYAWD